MEKTSLYTNDMYVIILESKRDYFLYLVKLLMYINWNFGFPVLLKSLPWGENSHDSHYK